MGEHDVGAVDVGRRNRRRRAPRLLLPHQIDASCRRKALRRLDAGAVQVYCGELHVYCGNALRLLWGLYVYVDRPLPLFAAALFAGAFLVLEQLAGRRCSIKPVHSGVWGLQVEVRGLGVSGG